MLNLGETNLEPDFYSASSIFTILGWYIENFEPSFDLTLWVIPSYLNDFAIETVW
jgi:hypothetical protein